MHDNSDTYDPFGVSLPLLVQYVPQLIRNGQHHIDWKWNFRPLDRVEDSSRYGI
jgi:hypothetical protein